MKTFKTIVAALIITSSTAFAHGEHKPGPNGGEIRMPGPFHTEVVSEGAKKLKIYLLDMKFQSPTTEGAELEVRFEGEKSSQATCEKEANFFDCTFGEEVLTSQGQLYVKATRLNKKGSLVVYQTPLKF